MILYYSLQHRPTCLGYYFWGRVKELAYFQHPTISENMKKTIKNIFREITIQELEEVQENLQRLQMCLEQHGDLLQ